MFHNGERAGPIDPPVGNLSSSPIWFQPNSTSATWIVAEPTSISLCGPNSTFNSIGQGSRWLYGPNVCELRFVTCGLVIKVSVVLCGRLQHAHLKMAAVRARTSCSESAACG